MGVSVMKIKSTKAFLVCLLCFALLAAVHASVASSAGEGGIARESGDVQPPIFGTNEQELEAVLADLGIEVPISKPSIYVNEAGYVSDRDKTILFVGGQCGNTFEVVRSYDQAVVYTGTIPESDRDKLSGVAFGVADFSVVDEVGTYYILTDIVGQSYPFTIAEDTYENLFLNLLRNMSDDNRQESAVGVCDMSFGMHAIMCAMQYNGSLFEAAYAHLEEQEQDKQLVTQLLYMANWLIAQQDTDGSLYGDYEATAAFCGVMAMSRCSFGKYEKSVDKEYQQAQERAWNWLCKQECTTDIQKNARFYAATQLFNSDGNSIYRKLADEFLKEQGKDFYADRFLFYGMISYLSSEKGVDRDLCTNIVMDITDRAQNLCTKAKEDTIAGIGVRTIPDALLNMRYLSFANYLSPNKEYTLIIENTIQYIGGLNEYGVCCIGADGKWRNAQVTQERNLEWNGIMLFGMSDMLNNLNAINNVR